MERISVCTPLTMPAACLVGAGKGRFKGCWSWLRSNESDMVPDVFFLFFLSFWSVFIQIDRLKSRIMIIDKVGENNMHSARR